MPWMACQANVVTKHRRAHQRDEHGQHRPLRASETGGATAATRSPRRRARGQPADRRASRPPTKPPRNQRRTRRRCGRDASRAARRPNVALIVVLPSAATPTSRNTFPEPLEAAVEPCTPQERGASDRLQRVAHGDHRGAPERNPRGGIDSEGGGRDRRPQLRPAQGERHEGDAGRWPDGARDPAQRVERQPQARRRRIGTNSSPSSTPAPRRSTCDGHHRHDSKNPPPITGPLSQVRSIQSGAGQPEPSSLLAGVPSARSWDPRCTRRR